jgi:ATP phosphoribosyltransferase regulatory subunit
MRTLKEEMNYVKKRNEIIKSFEMLVEQKGLIKVESDFFVDYDTFSAQNQRLDRRSLVKLQDLKGDIKVLKPDITSNLIKQVIERKEDNDIYNLFYSDYIFSYDNFELKSKRQFGVEVIGDSKMESDISIIELIKELLQLFNLDYMIEIGDQKFISIVLENMDLSSQKKNMIKQKLITKNLYELEELLTKKTPYEELLFLLLRVEDDLQEIKRFLKEFSLDQRLINEINKLINMKELLNDGSITFDLSIINMYDYYNGPIYKGYIKGYKRQILSGGRYDYLTEKFGKLCGALGFSIDMDAVIMEVLNND